MSVPFPSCSTCLKICRIWNVISETQRGPHVQCPPSTDCCHPTLYEALQRSPTQSAGSIWVVHPDTSKFNSNKWKRTNPINKQPSPQGLSQHNPWSRKPFGKYSTPLNRKCRSLGYKCHLTVEKLLSFFQSHLRFPWLEAGNKTAPAASWGRSTVTRGYIKGMPGRTHSLKSPWEDLLKGEASSILSWNQQVPQPEHHFPEGSLAGLPPKS